MKQGYDAQRPWADRFIKKQIGILNDWKQGKEHFFVSGVQADMEQNTDAIGTHGTRVCLRVRDSSIVKLGYAGEFTVRSVNNGFATEFHKLGWPDFMLYCIAGSSKNSDALIQWFIGDMQVFREHIKNAKALPKTIMNGDGTGFMPFRIDSIFSKNGNPWVVANSQTGYFAPVQPIKVDARSELLVDKVVKSLAAKKGYIRPLVNHDCQCKAHLITPQTTSRQVWVVCEECKRWKPKFY